MNIKLARFAYTPLATLGRLTIEERQFECFTVERPWLDNKTNVSCIPEGSYDITLGMYNRGGYPAYELADVPGRTHIKIHIGNTCDDIVGCIALGSSCGVINNKVGVSDSRTTYNLFMQAMNEQPKGKILIYTDARKGV